MTGVFCRNVTSGSAVLFAVAMVMVAFQAPGESQNVRPGDGNLTYARGQSVNPIYQGWMQNPDGSFDLHFSYINRNWQEEVDIPIGPDNNVQPAPFGPDAGQPTHFFPRQNRYQFKVRVPADFGSKEVVWTLTSHGQTNRAYGVLKPGYVMDDFLIQHEFGGPAIQGRKPPSLKVEGDKQRTVKIGQASPLVAVATDEKPVQRGRAPGGPPRVDPPGAGELRPGQVGGDFVRNTAPGLWLAWFVFRGVGHVKFDPPMPFKVWEDQRGGSPWAPGWQAPPIPPGNKWVYNVTFQEPGMYVLRCLVHTGTTFAYENVTFTVTP